MQRFEFIVEGPPVSLQTRNKALLAAWKQRVRSAAMQRWISGAEPIRTELEISITYFFDTEAPDVDNIIKPIQDALKGLVYGDDSQIVKTECRKKNINGSFRIKGLSPVLADGFISCSDFLHVRICDPSGTEDLD